jgi:glycosyltransferase involved in cell wall biosynthesis
VQEGHSGFLFDWRRPESLAEAIARLAVLSPRQRDAMGQAGRRFAQEHLSLARFADVYEKLFQRLLRGDSSGPAEVALQETATIDPVAQPAIAH